VDEMGGATAIGLQKVRKHCHGPALAEALVGRQMANAFAIAGRGSDLPHFPPLHRLPQRLDLKPWHPFLSCSTAFRKAGE
jgi:hypothetical protein